MTGPLHRRSLCGYIAAVVVGLLACGCGASGPTSPSAPRPAPAVTGVSGLADRFGGVPQAGPALGSPRAPYTLLEFIDLQCPFCARFDREVLPAVIQDFVRSGRLRIELRPVVFIGRASAPAGRAAIAAGLQGRMFQFADLFYRNQQVENSGYVTRAFIQEVASAVPGLDVAALERAQASRRVVSVLVQNAGLAHAGAVIGTPDFRLGPTGGVLAPFGRGVPSRASFIRRLHRALGRGKLKNVYSGLRD